MEEMNLVNVETEVMENNNEVEYVEAEIVTEEITETNNMGLILGLGAAAIAGIGIGYKVWKKKKQAKEADDMKTRVLNKLKEDGANEETIKMAEEIMDGDVIIEEEKSE